MRTIRFVFSISFLFFFNILQAQDIGNVKKHILKLYINGSYYYSKTYDYLPTSSPSYKLLNEQNKYHFGNLSFAIETENNKFFSHEYELMPIKIDYSDELQKVVDLSSNNKITIGGGKTTTIESNFRYQLNYYFGKDNVLVPYFGLSSQTFYDYYKIKPVTSNVFTTTEQNVGICLEAVPSILLKINKHFSFGLNVPIGIYKIKLNTINEENPAIALDKQKVSKIVGVFFPKTINIRLGLIYKI